MKRLIIFCLVLSFLSIDNQINAQEESTGLLGDNFSLEGALDVLKNASTLENFEKQLNNKDSDVNNLDLNDDGDIECDAELHTYASRRKSYWLAAVHCKLCDIGKQVFERPPLLVPLPVRPPQLQGRESCTCAFCFYCTTFVRRVALARNS